MSAVPYQSGGRSSRRTRKLKQAVLACMHRTTDEAAASFAPFNERDWKAALFWLDVSGMALYLLDRVKSLGIEACLPSAILARIENNLYENRQRTQELLDEAERVSCKFDSAGIPHALLKGITLTPDSVPHAELRWQTDLDFMIAENDLAVARQAVEELGYSLHASDGLTMEFCAGVSGKPDLANLYRAGTQRSMELHGIVRDAPEADRLGRGQYKCFNSVPLPALCGPDILVQQAIHLFKHLCGEHSRVSWVLEFWRHVEARRADREFWEQVRSIAAETPHADLALAVSGWLAADLFSAIRCEMEAYWPAVEIPAGVRAWLDCFAHDMLLSDTVGTKTYLLLLPHLPGNRKSTTAKRRIFPLYLPARITQAAENETLLARLGRYRIEAHYCLGRLQFHCVGGARYAIQAYLWQRKSARFEQS